MPGLKKFYSYRLFIIVIFFIFPLLLTFKIVQAADQNSVETFVDHEFIGGGSAMGWNGDDEYWSYALPFSFNFYGTDYSTVYVSSNGYVGFEDDISLESWRISISMTSPSPLIFVFGNDITTVNSGSYSADNGIFVTNNEDNVIIRWRAEYYGNAGSSVNAELILYDNDELKINYGDNLYAYPYEDEWTITVGITDGVSRYTASAYNDTDNSDLRFDNSDSLYWENGTGDEDGPSGNVFKEDRRCHWIEPPTTTWVKMFPTTKDGVSGIELTWAQYEADRVDILIDDGTGTYPWIVKKALNDGHEFLPNVSTSQSIKIKPYNHCNSGSLGSAISYNTFPGGWSGQVLGTSTSQSTSSSLDTGFSSITIGLLIGSSFLIYGIGYVYSNPRKLALRDFEKKISK